MNCEAKPSDKTITLVSTADEKFFLGLLVAVFTAIECASGTYAYDVIIFNGGIREDQWRLLTRSIATISQSKGLVVSISKIDLTLADLAILPCRRGSPLTNARLLVSVLLPNVKNVVYMDSDVVCRRGIEEFHEALSDGCAISACLDPYKVIGKDRSVRQHLSKSKWQLPYFNAGIIGINVSAWAVNFPTITALLESDQEFKHADQSLLNRLFYDQWTAVPAHANHVLTLENCANFPDHHTPSNLHFVGPRKPWLTNHSLFYRRFFDALFDKKLEEITDVGTKANRTTDSQSLRSARRKVQWYRILMPKRCAIYSKVLAAHDRYVEQIRSMAATKERIMHESPKIAIGVCTRGRPDGLSALLDSFVHLMIPEGYSPLFIVVENDTAKSLQLLIDKFASRLKVGECIYALETRLGIPFARNSLLDQAMAQGCEALALADDDEVVDPDWLVALHYELQGRSLHLVGGPVRILPAAQNASMLERAIWRGLVTRYAGLEAKALRKHGNGKDHQITIVTSNWLGSLDFIREQGLRFDESLGFSGGSDTRFFRDFVSRQGRSGWAPLAIVSEHWPRARLRPGYQFRRGRDQAISHFHNSISKITPLVMVKSVIFVVVKLLASMVLFPLALLDGGRSSVRALRAFGFAVGRILALCGVKSHHYAKIA
jgi:lipopolysaccharide biosynthesis glycosyltransferase